ncbi:MAG: protein kinase [Myxococcales bacterium]
MDGMPVSGKDLPAIGDEIAGKYRVETVIGQGGMGAVYSARNVLTGKRVAIKWLLPEHAGSSTRERLLREARIACSIEHPNVVDIYDVGEHQGGLFLVMEYLRGQPLSDVLAERGRLDPEELIALLLPTMRGVHAAHQAGVIHRDLKPENIILSESDGEIVPKVVDFGVSKTVGASSVPHSSLTRTGALVGTPHYMALEQVDGSNQIDTRTDVYAFGVLLYRALTGYYPFDGSSLGEVILKIGTKDAPSMRTVRPELPAGLDAVVLRALSRSRDLRFSSLEELATALEPFSPGVRFHREAGHSRSSAGASREQKLITPNFVSASAAGVPAASGASEPSASSVRTTPSPNQEGTGRMRTVGAFWIGAGLALVVLVGGAIWLAGRSRIAEAPLPPAPVAPAPAALEPLDAPEPAHAEPATALAPTQPSQAADPAAVMPTPVDQPAEVVEPVPGTPDVVQVPVAAPAVTNNSSAREPKRVKRDLHRHDDAPAGQQRIPGERTKGLSSDEF